MFVYLLINFDLTFNRDFEYFASSKALVLGDTFYLKNGKPCTWVSHHEDVPTFKIMQDLVEYKGFNFLFNPIVKLDHILNANPLGLPEVTLLTSLLTKEQLNDLKELVNFSTIST